MHRRSPRSKRGPIQSVKVHTELSWERFTWPASANIVFVNEYGSPATEIAFALESRGIVVERFNDVGSFSTGVPVDHAFQYDRSDPNYDELTVAVAQAKFEDGTVWQNPNVPDASVAPAPVGVPATTIY